MKKVVTFVFALLLVTNLTACGSSKQTNYEIKDGDPLELLEEAGYTILYNDNDSYNPRVILDNVEEKVSIEFDISSSSGEIWTIRYTNRKDKIEERVSDWGLPTKNKKTTARYVDSVRSTGITTQTLWNLICEYAGENNPSALINKTHDNPAIQKNKVGRTLDAEGYTFYNRYEAYDSGAYKLDIHVGNLETGIGYEVTMYKGKFHELNYTNVSKKLIGERVYYSGEHSGEEKTVDLYLESLDELEVSKKDFMTFFEEYQDAFFEAANITPGKTASFE